MPNSSKNNNQYKKAVNIISSTNIQPQEFLALLSGIRPAIRHTTSPDGITIIKKNFPDLFIYSSNNYSGMMENLCMISKKQIFLNSLIDHIFDEKIEGKLLGYPDCCVKNHSKYIERPNNHDLDLSIYNCYKDSGKCSPFINNLFSFSTRILIKNDEKNMDKYSLLNIDSQLPIFSYLFISHIPCRHDCEKSIIIGKKIDILMKKYFPSMEKLIINTLSRPVLYFSVFNQYIFDGYVKGEVLYYKKILPPYFPVDSKLLKKINEGNMIWVNKKQIVVMKDSSILYRYIKKRDADGFIVDFGEQ